MPDQTPLSPEEIADVQRLFGAPFFIPSSFKTWMGEQLALNIPDLPLTSLFGGRGITRSLGASTSVSAASANGTRQDLFSKVVQGGSLGANGHIRFVLEMTSTLASSDNTWNVDLEFGGQVLCTVSDFVTTTPRSIIIEGEVYNANSPAIQYGRMIKLRLTDGSGVANVAVASDNGESAVDTTVDQTLKLVGYWDSINANDHIDRTYVNVEVTNPVPLGATL